MKYFCVIMLVSCMAMLEGCRPNDELDIYNGMQAYSGVWRDTIFSNDDVYIEDLTIKENSIKYSLFNSATHVVHDTLSGTIVIGNENKIGWNCLSPINNKTRQTFWDVLALSPYQMTLYSNTYGIRNYKKVHFSTIEEERLQNRLLNIVRDTLKEMLQYKNYLPLHKNDLIMKFGSYNRLVNCDGISYFTHHPLFDKISFTENFDNDTIYSYTLFVNDWNWCVPIIESDYTKFRDVNATTEYIDSKSLATSDNVVIVDTSTNQISFKSIKDYDYWPNISRYLSMTIQNVKAELGEKYVYTYHEYIETGLCEYIFQTSKDSICSTIGVMTDPMGIIRSCSISLIKPYRRTQQGIKEAILEEENVALLLKKKFRFDKEETDENGNKVYYFQSFNSTSGIKLIIKLRLNYYQNGIAKLCCVTIDYNKL